ncbi:hypothetical protein [Eubacterium sp.]|uniref:hypothetical protein n=1 Tax=Eubacterium sp. TaxID=142586 RepID=UPI0025BA6061|nr:hypothetical protein [Eubacterium sp.]
MTYEDSIKWLESLKKAIGQSQYQGLWHYEQALDEIIELLHNDRFVELPCKIGEELFITNCLMYHHRLKDYVFIDDRIVMVIECVELQSIRRMFVDEYFGKTVFLTKEEAEAKLKELDNGTT